MLDSLTAWSARGAAAAAAEAAEAVEVAEAAKAVAKAVEVVAAAVASLHHHHLPRLHHPVVPLQAVHLVVDVALAAVGVGEGDRVISIRTGYVIRWISWRKMPENEPRDDRFVESRIPIPSPRFTKTGVCP